ncbi:MAG: hypothetical protein RLZZ253_713 [Verrucomicrobiota bacterium]|jgi:hypothetical protein
MNPLRALCLFALAATPVLAGEQPLFNGKDLSGWEGNMDLWSVKEGAIVGTTTAENPLKGNSFLIWKNGEVSDFELSFKYKTHAGNEKGFANSGVQYRSKIVDPAGFVVSGYQADFEAGKTYSGILYEEKGRGILAKRGQKVVVSDGEDPRKPKLTVTGEVGNSDEIQATIKADDWNEYKIVARGNHLQHFINGKQTIDVTDETAVGAKAGVLALQIHAGPPMQVSFKDIVLKTP